MATGRRATSGLGSNLYANFLANHLRWTDDVEPSNHSRHALEINTITPNGTALGLETSIVTSFFKAAVKRSVESALVYESHVNSVITSSVRVTSSRHLALQAHLEANENVRFTLEAQESATEKAPASFARIGVDYTTSDAFAGVKIDPVNGPTLQATMGGRIGAVGIGIQGAYDVGLDHSDRLGRFTTLDMATSYTHKELLALLQVNDGGRAMRLDLTQTLSPKLIMSSRFVLDTRKDKRVLRFLGKYALSETEALSSAIGSDGIFIGAFEWCTSKHLKTRVSAQMDLRHYESDSNHLGVSIEIS
ncbi:hypothetical protein DD238_001853 [Peronospora effusa]|uniref:Uncharacterized protein n=1 Tax=Peronospora effusa TaxID=542832 RepID=A0A3M6VSD8_9STRA|nr:hypothetical protein DD238_001853 [Peronospora effusa]RQM11338.1 hypothetical protein DD237_000783 [Peronospora effusa]